MRNTIDPPVFERAVLCLPAMPGKAVTLVFRRCASCGQLAFPPTTPGCGACGAPLRGAPVEERPATGVLTAMTTVHTPLRPGMRVPLVIGAIELASGVMRHGVIETPHPQDLRIGQAMTGVPASAADNAPYPCAFRPVEGNA